MTPHERKIAIEERLTQALAPSKLTISDESALHFGHSGSQGGGGHFAITIQARALQHKTPVTQHRMIYQALGDLLEKEIHALQIKVLEK